MFCDKCSNNLPDNAKFCDKCGNRVAVPTQNQSYTGFQRPENNVGANTTTSYSSAPTYSAPKDQSKLIALILSVCIMLLTLFAPIFGIMTDGLNSRQEEAYEEQAEENTFLNSVEKIIDDFDGYFESIENGLDAGDDIAVITVLDILGLLLAIAIIVCSVLSIISVVSQSNIGGYNHSKLLALVAIAFFVVILIASAVMSEYMSDMIRASDVSITYIPSIYTIAIGVLGVVTLVLPKRGVK